MSTAAAPDARLQMKNGLQHRPYHCLFNHEFMLFCDTGISRDIIAGYTEKFKDPDVDAVMCCPQAHRTNLFPSEVDPGWKAYDTITDQAWMKHFRNVLKYICDGGDPVAETLAVCRRLGKGFFISYRMNDSHSVEFRDFPTHNAFWRNDPLDRAPVIFDTIGAWRHPMYNGAGYDYTKYGEDIAAFCRDFRGVWEARAAGGDRHSCGPGTGSWRLPASGQRRLSGAPRAGAQPGRFDGQRVKRPEEDGDDQNENCNTVGCHGSGRHDRTSGLRLRQQLAGGGHVPGPEDRG